MAESADHEGFAPHPSHEGRPRGLARPGLAEVREPGNLVDGHCGAVLAQLAPLLTEPFGQLPGRADKVLCHPDRSAWLCFHSLLSARNLDVPFAVRAGIHWTFAKSHVT